MTELHKHISLWLVILCTQLHHYGHLKTVAIDNPSLLTKSIKNSDG